MAPNSDAAWFFFGEQVTKFLCGKSDFAVDDNKSRFIVAQNHKVTGLAWCAEYFQRISRDESEEFVIGPIGECAKGSKIVQNA